MSIAIALSTTTTPSATVPSTSTQNHKKARYDRRRRQRCLADLNLFGCTRCRERHLQCRTTEDSLQCIPCMEARCQECDVRHSDREYHS